MNDELRDDKSLKSLLSSWGQTTAGTNLPQPPTYEGQDIWITGLTEKTSEVAPGACFVARVRETSDGHPYIGKAIDQGAGMILAQKSRESINVDVPEAVVYLQVPNTAVAEAWLAAAWEGFPSRQLVMIGITGTDGKTTTANILLSILRSAGYRTGLLSTTRVVIGDEEEPLALHVTTPEAPIVQGHLRRMVDAGMTHCILEATSHGLAQHRVDAVDFDLAVVTNITREHLDYHGDFEQYRAAKTQLFSTLSADQWQIESANPQKAGVKKTAVLNRDDSSFEPLSTLRVPRQVTYGIYEKADVAAREIQYSTRKTDFVIHLSEKLQPAPASFPVMSPLTGEFNVYDTLAAASTALVLGTPIEAIQNGLAELEPISGRMQQIDVGQPFTVIVDFAHTPNALTQAIDATRKMSAGRIITVFGSAGKRDVEKRSRMAEISARDADLTVLTAEDPRTESLNAILQAMAKGSESAGGIEGETFWRIRDRGRAIYFALSLAQPGDLVLICGKGHEQSLCFGTIEYPWDDRAATRKALEALAKEEPMPDLGLPTFKE